MSVSVLQYRQFRRGARSRYGQGIPFEPSTAPPQREDKHAGGKNICDDSASASCRVDPLYAQSGNYSTKAGPLVLRAYVEVFVLRECVELEAGKRGYKQSG